MDGQDKGEGGSTVRLMLRVRVRVWVWVWVRVRVDGGGRGWTGVNRLEQVRGGRVEGWRGEK